MKSVVTSPMLICACMLCLACPESLQKSGDDAALSSTDVAYASDRPETDSETATDRLASDSHMTADGLVTDSETATDRWVTDGAHDANAAADGAPRSDAATTVDSSGANPDPVCPGGNTDGTAPDGTVAGAFTAPNPTLNNITLQWAIDGDANLNSTVRVRYRSAGSTPWTLSMPLRRIPAAQNEGFSWDNRHSGSVFDLEPGTQYEVELWLRDPDGGCHIQTLMVTTRPVPVPMAGSPVIDATPTTLASVLSAAQPGDIIELGAGTYSSFSVPVDGELDRPLVIRSSQGAVVDGTVDASQRSYVHIVGLNANRIRFDYSLRVAIIGNVVTPVGQFDGIGSWNRAEDSYIADNVVTGVTAWTEPALGASGDNLGECILVTGPGHVIAHNRVTGCRDNISFLEGQGQAVDQHSIDVIDNDIYNAADDGVEADFCEHNCRIMRNRFTNVFIAMSSQPGLGGPTYFIRNVVYSNVFNAVFKLNRGSIGDVVLHNTAVKIGDALAGTPGETHARQYFRNNIFIGGQGGTYNGWSSGSGRIAYMPNAASDGSYDYDGFGSLLGDYSGRIGEVSFSNMNELRELTSYTHAVQVDLNIFSTSVPFPANPFPAKDPQDLRIRADSAAVDNGELIYGINDGFSGNAPDLGAYEAGQSLPNYGPR